MAAPVTRAAPERPAVLTPTNVSGLAVCAGLAVLVVTEPLVALSSYAIAAVWLWLVFFQADERDDRGTRLLKLAVPAAWPVMLAAHDLVGPRLRGWAARRRDANGLAARAYLLPPGSGSNGSRCSSSVRACGGDRRLRRRGRS